ncbi:DNA repair protein RadA/Sms [Butyrivibrio sp. INlla18]|uniref:DNA repair protein RadA n=1 Tax=Butyrivibrio sp. INlla18 TaxID=1520806 RepID=UPI00088CABF2|nr:DNA repair protein RadA [Butyrivibrio sp. INlla18]SDA53394.1 DNA repair protein RadA/Sms [Butyrivibrio sp. INlla18]
MATKIKTVFYCQSCGYESSKWMGQCPGCKEWNTFVEETVKPVAKSSRVGISSASANGEYTKPQSLSEIVMNDEERADTHIGELNRVLGGGLVRGSLILVGGDPGIGKSTILLQVAGNLSADQKEVLYISGEESLRQIKLRANRIGDFSDNLKFMCETNLANIEEAIQRTKPEVIVIDSIQTMYNEAVSSAPGSVSQVRESTSVLLRIAKSMNITVFIVGHVTKEGQVAGPRVLEHMVDTVLYFEGDRHASYRILRAVKNRFGSTNEIGVFEMQEKGLVEVTNPSEFMLDGRPENASGSIVTCSVEGTRPILIEIQALVCRTNFGFPRRQANGTDYNRVNLLMAVLEKRLGLQMADYDAYVNLAGGMKVAEPSLDLGICLAIISSFKNKPISDDVIAFGEVGLSGEVRSVNMAEARVQEAQKLGFKTCIVPKALAGKLKSAAKDVDIIGVSSVADAMQLI